MSGAQLDRIAWIVAKKSPASMVLFLSRLGGGARQIRDLFRPAYFGKLGAASRVRVIMKDGKAVE
jgi:hypothetical protein